MNLSCSLYRAIVALTAASCAVGAPSIAPSTGSDAILSLRGRPEGVLVLQYRKEVPDLAPALVSVGIAADYQYIETGGSLTIYDYALRRIFTTSRPGSFISDSLYAEVWRRASQLTNRIALARLEGARGRQRQSESAAFWTETELGMTPPDAPVEQVEQIGRGAQARWIWRGDRVAEVKYRPETVPPVIRGSLRRLWRVFVQVHPAVADALAASGRMPAELWLKRESGSMAHWTLTATRWQSAARYPLPPHLRAAPTTDTGLYPQAFAALSTFVNEKAAPPTRETYKLRAQAAISRGHGLEALLWLTEMNMAYGPRSLCETGAIGPYCGLWFRAEQLAKADTRTSSAFSERAPSAADRYKFNDLPNAYLLKLSWLDLPQDPTTLGRAMNELGLLAALQASPVANFCKDAGLFYVSVRQPFAAWQVWDFGRRMENHAPGDLLDSIDAIEAELTARAPEFF